MIALIDSDIVAYRSACSAEKDDQWVALARADKMIQDILEDTGATSYKTFLTGSNNFRREIAPSYKANRPDERPQHWAAVREFLVTQHKAVICDGYEADDSLSMEQVACGGTTIICSIDKDLLQVPGKHYNFVKKEFVEVSKLEGLQSFYRGLLIGDRSDNIEGVVGLGKVKSAKIIDSIVEEVEMFRVVRELYNNDQRLLLNGQLMWLWRYPLDMWDNSKGLFGDYDEDH